MLDAYILCFDECARINISQINNIDAACGFDRCGAQWVGAVADYYLHGGCFAIDAAALRICLREQLCHAIF